MTKNLMELGKKKKKKKKWHDAIEDDSSRAKVWPARAVEEEKEEEDDEDGDERLDHRNRSSALMKVLASISFAEALQNSSTIYGVRVACETIPTRQSSSEKLIRLPTRRRQSLSNTPFLAPSLPRSLPRGNSTP